MTSLILLQRLLAASIETTIAVLLMLAVGALALRRAPRIVALLWLAVLARPLLTLLAGAIIPISVPEGFSVHQRVEARAVVTTVMTSRGPVIREQRQSTKGIPADTIAVIWLAGVALMLARSLVQRHRLGTIVAQTRPPSTRIATVYARLTAPSHHSPLLRVSDLLDGPAIAGTLRPVILIPAWMNESADESQVEWALRHELRHGSARDTLAIALRELAVMAFWFHPLVWLAAAKWEAATEVACDRDVVASDLEAVDYADALYRTLVNVRRQPRLQLATGLFATRSKIGARIAALIEGPLAPRLGAAGITAAAIIAACILTIGAGQASPHPGHHRGNLEERNDAQTLVLRYDFTEIDLAGDRITSLSPGGFAMMSETAGGTTRELRVDSTSRGLTRTYRVNGRVSPLDGSFEHALTSQLQRALSR